MHRAPRHLALGMKVQEAPRLLKPGPQLLALFARSPAFRGRNARSIRESLNCVVAGILHAQLIEDLSSHKQIEAFGICRTAALA